MGSGRYCPVEGGMGRGAAGAGTSLNTSGVRWHVALTMVRLNGLTLGVWRWLCCKCLWWAEAAG